MNEEYQVAGFTSVNEKKHIQKPLSISELTKKIKLKKQIEAQSFNIEFVNDNNFADGSLLDYSNHELTQEQLENITNYFTK
jgi:hypothetical protein